MNAAQKGSAKFSHNNVYAALPSDISQRIKNNSNQINKISILNRGLL
jgi:hypothetical protein